MLAGKHLIVGDMHWERYAELDRATMTWEGFDIDLIEAISHLLGFTYTIMEFDAVPPVTQTNDTALNCPSTMRSCLICKRASSRLICSCPIGPSTPNDAQWQIS